MTNVENNAILLRILEKKILKNKKSRTIYANNILTLYLYYVNNK